MTSNNNPDRIVAWMEQLAVDPSLRPLEDPDLLWMKAQLFDRQVAVRRSMKPMLWCETISRGFVGFAACWLALNAAKAIVAPAVGILSPVWTSLTISVLIAAAAVAAYPIVAGE